MDTDLTPDMDIRRVTRGTRVTAAARLVTGAEGSPQAAGSAFIRRAEANGLTLDYFWAVFGGSGKGDRVRARQSLLIIPQAGRTAMLFMSNNGPLGLCGDEASQHADRVGLLRRAFEEAGEAFGDRVRLLQALPSPEETWAKAAFAESGMVRLGELMYIRRPLARPGGVVAVTAWPEGVEVRPVRGLGEHEDGPALRAALERTYIDTLDCPGLCALRETADVVESHRSTGVFDPSLWWIVWDDDRPEGCVLLSASPEQDSVELVYVGLGPTLRGRGLGRPLLEAALSRAVRTGMSTVNCAVDAANEPARAMYARMGFSPFAERVAFVKRVGVS